MFKLQFCCNKSILSEILKGTEFDVIEIDCKLKNMAVKVTSIFSVDKISENEDEKKKKSDDDDQYDQKLS